MPKTGVGAPWGGVPFVPPHLGRGGRHFRGLLPSSFSLLPVGKELTQGPLEDLPWPERAGKSKGSAWWERVGLAAGLGCPLPAATLLSPRLRLLSWQGAPGESGAVRLPEGDPCCSLKPSPPGAGSPPLTVFCALRPSVTRKAAPREGSISWGAGETPEAWTPRPPMGTQESEAGREASASPGPSLLVKGLRAGGGRGSARRGGCPLPWKTGGK